MAIDLFIVIAKIKTCLIYMDAGLDERNTHKCYSEYLYVNMNLFEYVIALLSDEDMRSPQYSAVPIGRLLHFQLSHRWGSGVGGE